jgi:hypothetical protein
MLPKRVPYPNKTPSQLQSTLSALLMWWGVMVGGASQIDRADKRSALNNFERFEPVINNGMRSLYEFYTMTQRLVKFVFRVLEQWLLLDK